MVSILTKGIKIVPTSYAKLMSEGFSVSKALALCDVLGKDSANYENQMLAGRLLLYTTSRGSGSLKDYIEEHEEILSSRVVAFMRKHIDILQEELDSRNESTYLKNDYFSASSLIKQYLLRTRHDADPQENVQQMYLRIATDLYEDEGLDSVLRCFRMLSNHQMTGATPVLFRAGTKHSQKGSCFKFVLEDNMHSISDGVNDVTSVFKSNGGAGVCFSELRESEIGRFGMSKGPCSFLNMYEATTSTVAQTGMRNGAMTATLRDTHLGFDKFVTMNDKGNVEGRLDKVNTSCWMDDLFYRRYKNRLAEKEQKGGEKNPTFSQEASWTLFCPKKTPTLNNIYGVKFEREYRRLELLAKVKEEEFFQAQREFREASDELLDNEGSSRVRYRAASRGLDEATSARINYKTVDPIEIVSNMRRTSMSSGKPFMMNGGAVNYKLTGKNMGDCKLSNLCQEITLPTKPGEPTSCNLSSINMKAFVKGKLDWRQKTFTNEDICKAYDFAAMGRTVMSTVNFIVKCIYTNDNPFDVTNPDGTITRGKLAIVNYRSMPLAIGVSGQANALYEMDATYIDQPHEIFNKLFYAAKYFHELMMSITLAVRDGPYEEFNKGSYSKFVGVGASGADIDGMIEVKGSPLYNGQLQFDMWKEEAACLRAHGTLNEQVYDETLNTPVEPSEWQQNVKYAYVQKNAVPRSALFCGAVKCENPVIPTQNIASSEEDLIGYGFQITSIRRACRPEETELVFEPNWRCIRTLGTKYGYRASDTSANMPTASSANLLGNCESTEAHQTNIYSRNMKIGYIAVLNKDMWKDLVELGLWNTNLMEFIKCCLGSIAYIHHYIEDNHQDFDLSKFQEMSDGGYTLRPEIMDRLKFLQRKYRTMFEISQKFIINKLYAARARYITQSESKNCYIRNPADYQLDAYHDLSTGQLLKTPLYYLRQAPPKEDITFAIPTEILVYTKNLFETLGLSMNEIIKVENSTVKDSPIAKSLSEEFSDIGATVLSGTKSFQYSENQLNSKSSSVRDPEFCTRECIECQS